MKELIADANRPAAAPPLATTLSPQEQGWINATAGQMFADDPTNTLLNHARNAQDAYIKTYRPKIDRQLEEEAAWLKWRATTDPAFRTTPAPLVAATQKRVEELFDQLRAEENMPKLRPKAQAQEEKEFKQIAEDTSKIPDAQTLPTLRKILGAREAAFYMKRQDEKELSRLSTLLEQAQAKLVPIRLALPTATPETRVALTARQAALTDKVNDLQNELSDRETTRQDHNNALTTLNIEEAKIRAILLRKGINIVP
jgi:chromosome segregation ATPase